MQTNESKEFHALDRISIVLRAREGETLDGIRQFVQLGAPVAIGRGGAVIAAASDMDFNVVLDKERELHVAAIGQHQAALDVDPLLTACAPEMFKLLERIETKYGGLDAALSHNLEPAEQMWAESRQAMEEIRPLLCKAQGKECAADLVDSEPVNRIALEGKNVNQQDSIKARFIKHLEYRLDQIHNDDPNMRSANRWIVFGQIELACMSGWIDADESMQLQDQLNKASDSIPTTEKSSIVADSTYAQVRVTNIDDWLKTVKNAVRYEFLRDRARIGDIDADLCAAREEQCFFGEELDTEIDNALRLARLLEKHGDPE